MLRTSAGIRLLGFARSGSHAAVLWTSGERMVNQRRRHESLARKIRGGQGTGLSSNHGSPAREGRAFASLTLGTSAGSASRPSPTRSNYAIYECTFHVGAMQRLLDAKVASGKSPLLVGRKYTSDTSIISAQSARIVVRVSYKKIARPRAFPARPCYDNAPPTGYRNESISISGRSNW